MSTLELKIQGTLTFTISNPPILMISELQSITEDVKDTIEHYWRKIDGFSFVQMMHIIFRQILERRTQYVLQ